MRARGATGCTGGAGGNAHLPLLAGAAVHTLTASVGDGAARRLATTGGRSGAQCIVDFHRGQHGNTAEAPHSEDVSRRSSRSAQGIAWRGHEGGSPPSSGGGVVAFYRVPFPTTISAYRVNPTISAHGCGEQGAR